MLLTLVCSEKGSLALFVMKDFTIQVCIEVGMTYSSQGNQLPAEKELLTQHNQLLGVHVCACVCV